MHHLGQSSTQGIRIVRGTVVRSNFVQNPCTDCLGSFNWSVHLVYVEFFRGENPDGFLMEGSNGFRFSRLPGSLSGLAEHLVASFETPHQSRQAYVEALCGCIQIMNDASHFWAVRVIGLLAKFWYISANMIFSARCQVQ
jgi:hypothetical protein